MYLHIVIQHYDNTMLQNKYKLNNDIMEKLILKPEIIEAIKKDSDLFKKVADELKISLYTMPNFLLRNDARLTQANVLRLIRMHLGLKKEFDLLCEMQPA